MSAQRGEPAGSQAQNRDDAEWLRTRLPPVERIALRCEADYYGASRLIAARTGHEEPPVSLSRWTHGWIGQPLRHPRQLAKGKPHERHLVATDEQAGFLRANGFPVASAVGLPFVYVEDDEIDRRAGSLLVMPAHSLPYTRHQWNENEYADWIAPLKERFSNVVACINRYCVEHEVWTRVFDSHGIPWVVGADLEDANALLRMSRLFRSFEFMTTNAVGSHIAYAASSGCRVSIYGPLAVPRAEDYRDDPWYSQYPEVLALNIESLQESDVRSRWPELFCEPWLAEPQVEWGRRAIGEPYRRKPAELARLLGWSPLGRFAARAGGLWVRAVRVMKDPASIPGRIAARLPGGGTR